MGFQCVPSRGLELLQTSLDCRSPRLPFMAGVDPSRSGAELSRPVATSQALSVCRSILGFWLRKAAACPSKESLGEGLGVDSDFPNLVLHSTQLRST